MQTEIKKQLEFRFPYIGFSVWQDQTKDRWVINFDAWTRPPEVKKLETWLKKYMDKTYPMVDYELIKNPF